MPPTRSARWHRNWWPDPGLARLVPASILPSTVGDGPRHQGRGDGLDPVLSDQRCTLLLYCKRGSKGLGCRGLVKAGNISLYPDPSLLALSPNMGGRCHFVASFQCPYSQHQHLGNSAVPVRNAGETRCTADMVRRHGFHADRQAEVACVALKRDGRFWHHRMKPECAAAPALTIKAMAGVGQR